VTVAAAQDREGDARAVGGLGYALLATGQLRIDVTRIENTSATGRTGELRATTCVTSTTDSPACQTLWQVTRPGLQGGEVLEPLSITETYIVPPPGTYYIRFILEEIEQGGPRRFLLAHSATAETWVAPPQRVCLKYKKGKCKKWGTR
jgi:hypothetical protein